ncbi:uncharacterized protein Z518_11223 [Rhinocladiella mackenziei CBS 650.93]|uniref:Nucleoporin NUP188 n=1 Tax=Rhinocladiella mackenziei CBS 650.93 TaxID=1442369 RepID=A0A0D2IRZ0_9EURO|nr:uncharacterized protein Z518_11223 [Rhinocladiella mackenziei CBS 650.93]KIW99484.1 hypothetical protein Z518_11223 [Rhinocladiella mackenziei CBS 650.93]
MAPASWDDLLNALLSHEDVKSEFAVEVLSGERPKKILSQLLPSFPPQSFSSKTTFESTTSTIPSSCDTLYNLDELKTDALWLSKHADLDELESLRLTILEWQYRPESRLREGYSEAEVASLKDALGSDYVDKQLQAREDSLARDDTSFDTQNSRRFRLICRHLQQQVVVLRIKKELLDLSLLPASVHTLPSTLRKLASSLISTDEQSLRGDIEIAVHGIRRQLRNLESGQNWETDETHTPFLKDATDTCCLESIGVILELLMLSVRKSRATTSSESLLLWLQLMSSVGFFSPFHSEIDAQLVAIQKMQSMGSLVTSALLDLASTVATLNEVASSGQSVRPNHQEGYFFDVDSIHDIHELLFNQAILANPHAGPTILSWAIIIHQIRLLAMAIKENRESHHVQKTIDGVATFDAATGRRSSASSSTSFQQSVFEDLLEKITTSSLNEDPSSVLLDMVIGRCGVFDYIAFLGASTSGLPTILAACQLQTLQELIAVSQSFLGYTPDLVSAQLALLSTVPGGSPQERPYDPVIEFVKDKYLLEGFYDVSAARFPYECLPFLQFCRALAKANIFDNQGIQYVEFRLRNLTTFTQAAVRGVEYRTIREDESASFVALNKPVNMLDLTQDKLLPHVTEQSPAFSIIPADATGEVISDPDSSTKVIRWQLEYSCLAYMGRLLELHYMGLLRTSLSQFEDPEAVISEIIGIFATLLSTIIGSTAGGRSEDQIRQHCASILDEANSQLSPDADIVSYIFEILEQELQAFRRRSVSSFDCRILISCLDFVVVLTKIRPSLVWSNISRTSLFSRQSSATLVLGIVSAVEIPRGNFDFLERFAQLYDALIQLATTGPDDALSGTNVTSARRKATAPTVLRIQGPLLLTTTEILFNAYQAIPEWSFQSPAQQSRITNLITESFSDVLRYAFDIGDALDSFTPPTTVFSEPAKFLVSSFRAPTLDDVAVNPILRILFSSGQRDMFGLSAEDEADRHVRSTLSLATLLVRYGQRRGLPLSSAEVHIFNAMPLLVRILQTRPSIRAHCLGLIRSIVTYVDQHQPSSLLGHLGSASCLDLLHLAKHIDQDSHSSEVRVELWKFMALLVKTSQQWLAVVMLTGSAPDAAKKAKSPESPTKCLRGKDFLKSALGELSNISNLLPQVAASMLEFALEAQQNWSWLTNDLNTSRDFLTKLVSFVTLIEPSRPHDIDLAYQNLIASLVTDLSAVHLHHAKITRDIGAVKIFIPLVHWLTSNAVEVSSYNTSLHSNLRRNFAAKYNGLSVSAVQRTGLTERQYGFNFFYDLDYADKLFCKDSFWNGGSGTPSNQSFSAEFRRANVNLSVVDSELILLLSLQRLCFEHCKFFVQDREIQKAMAHIVQNCLQANSRSYPAEAIFDSLFQTRADLSIALLRELIVAGAKGSDFIILLESAWDAVRFRNGSYEQAIVNGDLTYWRSMLYVLLMATQFHVNKKRKPTTIPGTSTAVVTLDPANTTFLEITTRIVAEGFKSAVSALQDQKQSKLKNNTDDENNFIGPRDISLLVTMMQTILRLPNIDQFSVELAERISSSGIISACVLLYSWAHLLTGPESDNQPRYADFCVQLLSSVSSLPLVAEELAIEGVLNRILASKTTEYLQRVPGGASHVDPRPNCGFLYRIWATGLLPLCLNLLHAVGGPIAAEISSFLNQFPNQLVRASTSFMLNLQTKAEEGTDVLTLTVAGEAGTLALISYILSSYRDAGASAAVDSTSILPLKGYDEHRKAIAEDVRDVLALKEDVRRKMTVPTDERELTWQTSKDGDKLDAKIVQELQMALASLGRDDDEDEK